MPTSQPLGRNSIAESSLPPNLRKKRKSGNTKINSSVTNVYNAKKSIVLDEVVGALKPISISNGKGYKANKTTKPATAFSIDSGIVGSEIDIATTGDVLKFPTAIFIANELVWLGNDNNITQEPDFENGDYQQVLGMAISTTEMLVNIDNQVFIE